jgi:hypothetical protein
VDWDPEIHAGGSWGLISTRHGLLAWLFQHVQHCRMGAAAWATRGFAGSRKRYNNSRCSGTPGLCPSCGAEA